MRRRDLLRSALATTVIQPVMSFAAATPIPAAPEWYELRRYNLRNGQQPKLTEQYFATALIPALRRLGLGPVGAFRLDVGPETPAFYLLIPGPSPAALLAAPHALAADQQFLAAADPFWAAPATAPSFVRTESSLLEAFAGFPRLIPPPGGPAAPRIFQLRTYESPSDRDHLRKIEMFEHGEFDIFRNAGFHQVFFGATRIGPRLPSLTYLLSFPDQPTLDASWKKFVADPAWHKLSTDPRYAFEEIVSNITNLLLSPLACSEL